jgi:hypothetical protein
MAAVNRHNGIGWTLRLDPEELESLTHEVSFC